MVSLFKRKPVAAKPATALNSRPRGLARNFIIVLIALGCGLVALGYFTAGAYVVLRDLYNPTAALFMIGGFFAAVSVLLVLYLVLGGHEVAQAAHSNPSTGDDGGILEGLTTTGSPRETAPRGRLRSISWMVFAVFVASYTALKRLTR